MEKPVVSIVMGSDSDLGIMSEAAKQLAGFGIPHEIKVLSAHRSPQLVAKFCSEINARGIKVIIAGAGGAAHLAGVIAAQSIVPVIGVPIDSSSLKGLDSLLATVQMPSGIPVATVAIGKSGAVNAGLLAVQILAVHSNELQDKLKKHKEKLADSVVEKNVRLEKNKSQNS